jgi:heme-degrading monooxygenase HmoA
MTLVLVKHAVKDYTAWKSVFDGFADFRRASGEKSYRIWQPENDGNNLTLLFEWDTPENAHKFMESSRLKETMQKAGVASQPEIQYLHEAASGKL